jgi:hypothetical protein
MESRESTDSYRPWYERWPELLDWERERFEAWKLPWVVDEEARAHGFLVIESEVEYRGDTVPIRVEYPSETPELPPTVFSDPAILGRHQQPFRGNFCLLASPEDDWNARDWGAADLIGHQLQALLRDSEAGEEVVREREAPIPEPASATFHYREQSVVLIPGNLAHPEGEEGTFRLQQFDQARFVLAELDGERGDERLVDYFPSKAKLSGRWRRLGAPPPRGPDGSEVLAWLRETYPDLVRFPPPAPPRRRRRGKAKGRPEGQPTTKAVGLVFPEEADPDGAERDGWLILLIEKSGPASLLHAQVTSTEERARRTPELTDLPARRVVVVGLGSLGGETAVQMARAGVGKLVLIDWDRFEANNAVRHVLGVDQAGRNKCQAVAEACRRANPFSAITGDGGLRFGDAVEPPPLERLYDALGDADLVIETTGVHQIQLLVGRVAWELNIPLVLAWLSDGSRAGEVARLVPGKTACGRCFSEHQTNREVLIGEADPDAAVFAQGCVHPTTSGAGFEASEVVANAARLAAAMLADDYPDPGWDHAVLNFRRRPDDPDHPRFGVEELRPNDRCEACRRDAG